MPGDPTDELFPSGADGASPVDAAVSGSVEPWRLGDFATAMVVSFFGVALLTGLAIALVEGGTAPPDDRLIGWIALSGTASFVVAVALTQLFVRRRGRGGLVAAFGLRFNPRHLVWVLAGLALSLVASLAIAALGALVGTDETPQGVARAVEDSTGPTLMAMLVVVIVFAPVGEELLYRGLLFRWARQRFDLLPAALVSGGVFSLAHVFDLDFSSGPTLAVSLAGLVLFAILGTVAAIIAGRERSLMPAIWLHLGFNLLGATQLVLLSPAT